MYLLTAPTAEPVTTSDAKAALLQSRPASSGSTTRPRGGNTTRH